MVVGTFAWFPIVIAHGRNIFSRSKTDFSSFSRVAIKKYVQANHKAAASSASFETQLNKAIRTGVEKGEFAQPKGMSFLRRTFSLNWCISFSYC